LLHREEIERSPGPEIARRCAPRRLLVAAAARRPPPRAPSAMAHSGEGAVDMSEDVRGSGSSSEEASEEPGSEEEVRPPPAAAAARPRRRPRARLKNCVAIAPRPCGASATYERLCAAAAASTLPP
jgi:hypothetical protein